MGRTACTEPQCLYSTAIPLLPLWTIRPVQSLSACTVQLYLYSPYGPYGLYRASVFVQYSYTSTPPMDHTACTEPQILYSTAIPLLPLWAVQPVQSLSACTRVHFMFTIFSGGMQSCACANSPFIVIAFLHACSVTGTCTRIAHIDDSVAILAGDVLVCCYNHDSIQTRLNITLHKRTFQ